MEHDEIVTLMMEALDGELEETRRQEMELHVQTCARCSREWQALQAIHQLFLQSPVLRPAAGFTQRTLAQLPNPTHRLWLVSAVYGFLLLAGILPLVFLGWLVVQFGPALNQPVFVRSLGQAGSQLFGIGEVVLAAIWQGVGNFGQLLGQQPAILGLLFVMIGAIFLWGGIYSQLTRPQRA